MSVSANYQTSEVSRSKESDRIKMRYHLHFKSIQGYGLDAANGRRVLFQFKRGEQKIESSEDETIGVKRSRRL